MNLVKLIECAEKVFGPNEIQTHENIATTIIHVRINPQAGGEMFFEYTRQLLSQSCPDVWKFIEDDMRSAKQRAEQEKS